MANPDDIPAGKPGPAEAGTAAGENAPEKPRRMMPPMPPPKAPTQADGPAKEGVAPKPEGAAPKDADKKDAPKPDPTRYGDWEKNGRCIDF